MTRIRTPAAVGGRPDTKETKILMATLTEWGPMGLQGHGWHAYYLALIGLLAVTRLLSPRRSSPTEVLMMGFAVLRSTGSIKMARPRLCRSRRLRETTVRGS